MKTTKRKTKRRGKSIPVRLPSKLRQIRLEANLTQGKMLRKVNPNETDETNRARISQYEKGIRAPSIIEVQNYADFAGVNTETLTKDDLDLPAGNQLKIPEKPSSETESETETRTETRTEGEIQTDSESNTESGSRTKSESAGNTQESGEKSMEKNDEKTDNKPAGQNILPAKNKEASKNKRAAKNKSSKRRIKGKTSAASNDQKQDSENASSMGQNEKSPAEKSALVTDEQQHPESGTSTDPADQLSALTIAGTESTRIPVSDDLLNRLKPIYYQLLEELPFEKMSNLSFDKLLNYVLAAALDDHRQKGTESVLERYLKQLADEV